MKCQSVFSRRNKKYIINLHTVDFAQRVVKNDCSINLYTAVGDYMRPGGVCQL